MTYPIFEEDSYALNSVVPSKVLFVSTMCFPFEKEIRSYARRELFEKGDKIENKRLFVHCSALII